MAEPMKPEDKAEKGRAGYGTTEALDAIIGYLNEAPSNYVVMLAINIETLVRNAADTTHVKPEDAVAEVKKTMSLIANEIAYICGQRWAQNKHHILFYYVDNSKAVSSNFRRVSNSASAIVTNNALRLLLRSLSVGDQKEGNVEAHVRMAPQMRVPSYKGIRDVVEKLVQKDVPLLLLSHMPMDYHSCTGTGRPGFLFRSHTGAKVKLEPSSLAPVVFKNTDVPFYPITHVLLGDKYLVKGVLEKQDKKRFMDLCKSERMIMHTNNFVTEKIRRNSFPLPYSLD
jgi:hypothetical protein